MKHQHNSHHDGGAEDVPEKNPQGATDPLIQIAELQKEIAGLQIRLNEKEEQHLRSKADLQNVRRRAEEERAQLPKLGTIKMFLAIIPALDHIELALKNKPAEETDWTKGVKSIFTSLQSALQAEGIERIDQTGVAIDPEIHEVIVMDGEHGDAVTEILQAGYRMHGKVIRPAKVKAGTK